MSPLLPLIPESELPPVLVTGGAGFIGSHLVEAIGLADHVRQGAMRSEASRPWCVARA